MTGLAVASHAGPAASAVLLGLLNQMLNSLAFVLMCPYRSEPFLMADSTLFIFTVNYIYIYHQYFKLK